MWIADIDIPQPLLDAFEEGNLVFFVGAGASRAAPSNLPDFSQLVREIGQLSGMELSEADVRHPDVSLGRLEDSGVNVHRRVADSIGKAGSQANRVHSAIAGLAIASKRPRIVTTNYDRHLTSALSAIIPEFDIYEAPALPVGDDFEGIVHLHGSLAQPSRRLVVTDADFGRAYLRDGWAARFLERMFSAFTVVFIGYSHGDVVMQYLARSLGPGHSRYVFTDNAQNAEWRRLGLLPVPYPNADSDHSALLAALERWRDLARMGQVEHRARIADLVSGEPPTIPEEVSYLDAVLKHPERIRYFEEKARFDDAERARRWFRWVEGRPAFLALFSADSASAPTARGLMSWICGQYIVTQEGSGQALRAFREKPWPPETWTAITHSLFAVDDEFPRWLTPWLQLILERAPHHEHLLLDMMLSRKDWSKCFDLALMVFADRTRPHLKRSFDFGDANAQPRFEVVLHGDEYWLTEDWTNIFLPRLDQHIAEMLILVGAQIAGAYRSLRSLDSDLHFDPLSYARSAIEEHEQDRHREPMDVLIDAARDSLEAALVRNLPLAVAHLETWGSSRDALLQRLSIHGWRRRTDVTADEKLTWLLGQNFLWETYLQQEVFQLLLEAFPVAENDVTQIIVDAAVTGPVDDDDYAEYRSYNLLGWLANAEPHREIAKEAFERAQALHPEFALRDHPDLNHYSSSGFVQNERPFSAQELHELIGKAPEDALDQLRAFRGVDHSPTGVTWVGALLSLHECVRDYPEDGMPIAAVLKPSDRDLRRTLVNGWSCATLGSNMIDRVLKVIDGWDRDESRHAVSAMLHHDVTPEHPTPWHHFVGAQKLASQLWPTTPVQGALSGGTDLVTEAINHPAGQLAEFWTRVVQWEWSKNEETWDGIPEVLVTELDRMVLATDRNGLLAKTLLASRLHFFFAADHEWCTARLLPLFVWAADTSTAAAVWEAFLYWGRWSDALLDAGLLAGYFGSVAHLDELPERVHGHLADHLASIAMHGACDPEALLTRFHVAAPEALRITWARRVAHLLIDLDQDEASAQWDRWIRAYWVGRNDSVPLGFTDAEASATASWVVGLGGRRSEAVDLALGSRAGLEQNAGFLYRLKNMELASEARDWARLITHLLKNSNGEHWGLNLSLADIFPKLRQGSPPPDLSELVEEAMRLGVTDAADY